MIAQWVFSSVQLLILYPILSKTSFRWCKKMLCIFQKLLVKNKKPNQKFNICCFPTKNYFFLPIAISSEFLSSWNWFLLLIFFLTFSLHLFVNPFISLYIVQIVWFFFALLELLVCFAWRIKRKSAIVSNIVVSRMHFYADNYCVFMYGNIHICRICSVSNACTACGLFSANVTFCVFRFENAQTILAVVCIDTRTACYIFMLHSVQHYASLHFFPPSSLASFTVFFFFSSSSFQIRKIMVNLQRM